MLTPDTYKAALEVITELGISPDLYERVSQRANASQQRDAHAIRIGSVVSAKHCPLTNGRAVLEKILKDGWLPPRGFPHA